MKIDLVGPARRGLAMGFNEAAGYGAVALTALATGYLAAAYGLRPAPFFLGIAFAALGLGLSTLFVRETRDHARLEASSHVARADGRHDHLGDHLTNGQVFVQTRFREPALSSASQAGMVNNLNDGLAWGLFPILFASAGLSVAAHRRARRALPGGVGPRPARHRRPVGPIGPQVADRRRHVRPGRRPGDHGRRRLVRLVGGRRGAARRRHRHGLPDPARRDRRRRPPGLAGPRRRHLPALARRRLRRRRRSSPASLADLYGVRAAIGAVAALTAASGLVVAVRMYETRHDPAPVARRTRRSRPMSRREAKNALYEQFARAGKGLANPKRLELLDLLAQGEYSVEALAAAAGLGLSTASAHLQALKDAGLVRTRREGTFVHYRLAGDDVAALFALLRTVATTHLADADRAAADYLGSSAVEDTDAVARDELLRRARPGTVVVLDVRPTAEYAAGHIPGAVSVPLDELEHRLEDLPADVEIVAYCRGAYCVLAYDAVDRLTAAGRRARRLHEGMLEWRLAGLPIEDGVA